MNILVPNLYREKSMARKLTAVKENSWSRLYEYGLRVIIGSLLETDNTRKVCSYFKPPMKDMGQKKTSLEDLWQDFEKILWLYPKSEESWLNNPQRQPII